MTEAAQPRMARGTKLTAGILVAALFAMLAFAPLASAAPDPVEKGVVRVEMNKNWFQYLHTFGIQVQRLKPATVKGRQAKFMVKSGEMDPTNGLGALPMQGGLKFRAGKKQTVIKGLVLNTGRSALIGKVAGKKMKLGKLVGLRYSRQGFGTKLILKQVKLEKAAANRLNAKLGFAKGKPKPFLGNKLIAKVHAWDQPSTVTLVPANNLVFDGDTTLLGKLSNVKTSIETISPTSGSGTSYSSEITGGTLSPTASAGTVMSAGGLKLVQHLPVTATTSIDTTITLGSMYVDLSAKTVTVEVIAESNAEVEGKKPLNLGNLGRSSVADLSLEGATVVADPTNRTIVVQNARGTLQPVSAEVLNGFVSVYKGYIEAGATLKTCEALPLHCTEDAEKAIAAEKAKAAGEEVAKNEIKSGEALGNFSFTGQAQ